MTSYAVESEAQLWELDTVSRRLFPGESPAAVLRTRELVPRSVKDSSSIGVYYHHRTQLEGRRREIERQLRRLDQKQQRRDMNRGQAGVFYRRQLKESLERLQKRKVEWKAQNEAFMNRIDRAVAMVSERQRQMSIEKTQLQQRKQAYALFVRESVKRWAGTKENSRKNSVHEDVEENSLKKDDEIDQNVNIAIPSTQLDEELALARVMEKMKQVEERQRTVRDKETQLQELINEHVSRSVQSGSNSEKEEHVPDNEFMRMVRQRSQSVSRSESENEKSIVERTASQRSRSGSRSEPENEKINIESTESEEPKPIVSTPNATSTTVPIPQEPPSTPIPTRKEDMTLEERFAEMAQRAERVGKQVQELAKAATPQGQHASKSRLASHHPSPMQSMRAALLDSQRISSTQPTASPSVPDPKPQPRSIPPTSLLQANVWGPSDDEDDNQPPASPTHVQVASPSPRSHRPQQLKPLTKLRGADFDSEEDDLTTNQPTASNDDEFDF